MQKKDTTCFFSGYRPEKMPFKGDESHKTTIHIKNELKQEILNAYHTGYTNFVCGMSRGFDFWAGETVLSLQKEIDINLICAVPFFGQESLWNEQSKRRYRALVHSSSSIFFISDKYSPDVFHARNRFMADGSSRLICYYDGLKGGTKYTINYAKKQNIEIINIADNQLTFNNL